MREKKKIGVPGGVTDGNDHVDAGPCHLLDGAISGPAGWWWWLAALGPARPARRRGRGRGMGILRVVLPPGSYLLLVVCVPSTIYTTIHTSTKIYTIAIIHTIHRTNEPRDICSTSIKTRHTIQDIQPTTWLPLLFRPPSLRGQRVRPPSPSPLPLLHKRLTLPSDDIRPSHPLHYKEQHPLHRAHSKPLGRDPDSLHHRAHNLPPPGGRHPPPLLPLRGDPHHQRRLRHRRQAPLHRSPRHALRVPCAGFEGASPGAGNRRHRPVPEGAGRDGGGRGRCRHLHPLRAGAGGLQG